MSVRDNVGGGIPSNLSAAFLSAISAMYGANDQTSYTPKYTAAKACKVYLVCCAWGHFYNGQVNGSRWLYKNGVEIPGGAGNSSKVLSLNVGDTIQGKVRTWGDDGVGNTGITLTITVLN